MLKGVIAEDNVYFLRRLEQVINTLGGVEITFSAQTGKELLAYLRHNEADLAFLDIGLPDLSGLEVARCIRMQYPFSEIIFITAHGQYLQEAVKLYAADYITKPLNVARLKETIGRIRKKHGESDAVLELPTEGDILLLREKDIYVIEALGHKVRIYCRKGLLEANVNLKTIESKLGEGFFRTSRSYIVNVHKVTAIRPYSRTCYELLITNDCKAYLSKDMYEEFRCRAKRTEG